MTSDTAVMANDNHVEESMADHVFEIVIVSLLVRILGVNWKTYVERNRNPSENKISLTIDPYDTELKAALGSWQPFLVGTVTM